MYLPCDDRPFHSIGRTLAFPEHATRTTPFYLSSSSSSLAPLHVSPNPFPDTPTSGIWQTVWLENVSPDGYFRDLQIRTDLEAVYITATVEGGEQPTGLTVVVLDGATPVAKANGIAGKEIKIAVPTPKLWSPDSPFLYTLNISSSSDAVGSYCGLRTLELGAFSGGSTNTRLMLNKEPVFAAGWLDQSWW